MNVKSGRKSLRIGTWIVVALVGLLVSQPGTHAISDRSIPLQPPSFLTGTEDPSSPASTSDIGALLDAEAGISAYYKAPDAITLSQVRGQFRTIETETANYIIGSVPVPSHPEHFDAHVYVNTNGWILAYYLRADPVSKIADVYVQTVNTTKLKTVVSIIAGAAGMPFTDVMYYDFRYPNATNMLLVGEDYENGNDFTIQLPSSYGYFERGWALNDFGGGYAYFRLDGVNLTSTWGGSSMYYGTISASQLLPDITHTIVVDDDGILVIVYRVP